MNFIVSNFDRTFILLVGSYSELFEFVVNTSNFRLLCAGLTKNIVRSTLGCYYGKNRYLRFVIKAIFRFLYFGFPIQYNLEVGILLTYIIKIKLYIFKTI